VARGVDCRESRLGTGSAKARFDGARQARLLAAAGSGIEQAAGKLEGGWDI
jgi:hypothetical protein